MINLLNIFLALLNIGFLIALVIFTKKIKDKNFKVEILETKVKAVQKRITNEQNQLNELKQRLEEQKIVLNQKWDRLQNENNILDEKASKIDEERRLFKEEQAKVTSQKIEIEQHQIKIDQMTLNLKEKWEQQRKEIHKQQTRLAEELKRINEAKQYFESNESKIKTDYQKVEKEKNYLSAQFKELEISKRDLEIINKKLLEQEQQLREVAKKQIEEKMVIDREREKIHNEKMKIEEQKAELAGTQERLERVTLKIKNEKAELERLKHESDFQIAFQKPDRDSVRTKPISSRFHLEGKVLRDDSDGAVPLFGKELPRIIDRQLWNDVDVIVIGEEGKGSGQLRWKFKPEKNSPALDLNQLEQQGTIAIISKSKESWFFIAFYDKNRDLIDSLDFRFMSALNAIAVDEHPYLPGANGHQAVKIKFLHDKSCSVRLLNHESDQIAMKHDNETTRANIPTAPDWDVTAWEVADHFGRKAEIKLAMNRIWWSLCNESEQLNKLNATDKILEIPAEKIQTTAPISLAIWLPKRHEIQQIAVGFDKHKRKILQVARNDEKLLIPLGDVIDCNELQKIRQKQQLGLWLDEEINVSIPVAVILPRWLSCKVKDCHFKSSERDEIMAHVMQNHFHHFFRAPNYEEVRSKCDLDLPAHIYQCGYCGDYVPADHDSKNPTSAIIEHIEQCPKAEKKDGSVQIQFRIVKDSNEIRENVITDLPHIWKCNCCDQLFNDQAMDVILRHLISAHDSEVYGY